ncbi:MAG TPA: NADH-quinone oxidoreductase subunit N [Tepidisphaeraceae bacterium]|nr:NADH-quinone oxidoreductase subunit N [Tepidisphaeraceae bacterium]
MSQLCRTIFPELVLVCVAGLLFLMGMSNKPSTRRFAPAFALLALAVVFISQLGEVFAVLGSASDPWRSMEITQFARYIRLATAGLGILLVMLAWPSEPDFTGGPAMEFGQECCEFFGLMLLSICGLFLVAGANDIMLLFLGIELASLPTYIMVSISRPLPVAQEAGVKYFFLGAMAAAVMLFGFSYLYGTTGTVYLQGTTDAGGTVLAGIDQIMGRGFTSWEMLALVLLIVGFAFKMVAVPLHYYAPDVYQGAATPVTAFISYIPKAAGFVALIKVFYATTGGTWVTPREIQELIWWLAVLTMTFGNIVALRQHNVKRILAYSSIAHTGYMLVGITALVSSRSPQVQHDALLAVLFYLVMYGLTNVAAFGVLILLPSRESRPATSAETIEDIAGMGRTHVGLGLAMSAACFSLIGMPLTVGLVGKVFLFEPALHAGLVGLAVIMAINAAISAAYYLRIIAALFLRPVITPALAPVRVTWPSPVLTAVALSAIGLVLLGTYFPLTNRVADRAATATMMELTPPASGQIITASASR